jgi:hypothetical protein
VKYEIRIEFVCRIERPGHIRKDNINMHLKIWAERTWIKFKLTVHIVWRGFVNVLISFPEKEKESNFFNSYESSFVLFLLLLPGTRPRVKCNIIIKRNNLNYID